VESARLTPRGTPILDSILGVYSLTATSSDLYLGGDFTKVSGVDQEHVADRAITP
jgi:hypothetical protein